MNKVATFIRTWIKSLTEPNYYNHVIKAKLSFSLKYFLFFYFVLSVLLSFLFHLRTVPIIREVTNSIVHDLTTKYPQDLEITFEPGRMVVQGVEQPYNVEFPDSLKKYDFQGPYQYLFTFDSTSDIASPNAFITFTQTEMIVRQLDGTKQSYPLTEVEESFTINKNAVGMFTSLSQTYIDRIINYLPIILFFLLVTLLPLANLFVLLFYSLFTLAVSMIWNKKLGYKKCFQIGLHTITFAETVRFLQDQLFSGVDISYFFSLAFLGSTMIALYSIKSTKK